MTGNSHFFVEWKEQFVSQERGNRVVHYFLKDSAGESILAVVGTERSVRHMFYVVSEEFVRIHGAENSIHAGFKWRSRREVVDWLTSMLSKQHLQGDRPPKSPKHDLAQALEFAECPVNGFGVTQGRLSRSLKGHNSEILWSGTSWTCGKQLKHYPAFCRNGTRIGVQSFVFVMAKEDNHYLAYLEDIYEDKKGQKKVKVRWFHHNREVKGVIPLRNVLPREVFITPYSQVVSAECVDGPAAVLTREHYKEYLVAFPSALSARIHLCFRQFRSNKVKPFDLRKLRGYFDQPILSCLNSKPFPGAGSIVCGLTAEEDEEWSPSENARLVAKRTRSGRGCETFVSANSEVGISGSKMMNFEPSYQNLRYGSSRKRLVPLNHVECQQWCHLPFKVDQKIEFLSQDSGIRGCWFRCTVLHLSRKHLKVQYDDVQDEDEYGNLEEWIPSSKLAAADKLGMRCSGRPIIRPAPPNEQRDLALEVGSAVDAWWSDGWWEGVVTGVDASIDDTVQVYFPGENFSLNIHKKDVRISRDWVGDQWIDIQAKRDILSSIPVTISPDTKVSMMSTIVKDIKSDGFAMSCTDVPTSTKLAVVEGEDPKPDTLNSCNNLFEGMDCDDGRKPLSSNDEANGDDGSDINVSHGRINEVQGDDGGEVHDEGDVIEDNGDNLDEVFDKLEEEEVLETSEKNCKAIEFMEVTA